MSKTISLKKNTIANYLGQFYTMFIGIFMLPFYLEYLGAEAYGLVGFFTMLMSWMAILDMGMSSTLAREAAKLNKHEEDKKDFHKALRSIEIFFLAGVSIVITLLVIFSQEIAQSWLTIEHLSLITVADTIKLMALIVGLRLFVSLYQGGVIGFENQVWLNGYKIVMYTIRFGGAFLIIVYISSDIYDFFIYQLIVAILEFIVIRKKLYHISSLNYYVKGSVDTLKSLSPFALSVAYGAILWLFITQIDKLMLSHYLPLKEYGFFSIIVVVANAVMLMFQPIGQAILPRMTNYISNNNKQEAISLYRQSTQLVSIIIFSVAAVIITYPYELLLAWTGNHEASLWSKDILRWYVAGNGIVAFLTLLYYLQHAHGNLKYHIRGNTYFGVVQIFIILAAVHFYGALGAGIAFFTLQLIVFLFWSAFIHSKFLPNINKQWILKDIGIYLLLTLGSIFVLHTFFYDFTEYSRVESFGILIFIGGIVLGVNIAFMILNKKLNFMRN